MRRSLLLALAAAALVAAPHAWADDQHPGEDHNSSQPQHGGPQHPGPHPGGPQGQPQGHPQGHPQAPPQGQAQHGWGGQPQGRPQGQPQGQVQHGWGGQPPGGRPGVGQPANRGPQAGHWNPQVEQHFDRRANPGQWAQTRNDWRGAHSGWNHTVIWGSNHDWWRGRSEFRGYAGPRVGFWFIPGVGYYQAPQAYWGRHWGYGDYLPQMLWQYQVNDWADYGLPPPPWGCAWVWIDGGVALIDLSDGYVLDVEYGLW
jgi:Ni/Co efflux regulator RcnB